MFNLLIKTVVVYFVLLFCMRIMGKRELAQMESYDLVIALVIAEAAAMPLDTPGTPLLQGLIPIFVLTAVYFLIARLSFKSVKINKLFEGYPAVVVHDGIIQKKALADTDYNMYDLIEALRIKGFDDISKVSCAILETSGKLSVFSKKSEEAATKKDVGAKTKETPISLPLIIDGVIQKNNLDFLSIKKHELETALGTAGIEHIGEIFFAGLSEGNRLTVQLKDDTRKITVLKKGW